jgi:eukaryotic-like serine/threonine-protein kinase
VATALPERVQLDRYFYRVKDIKQSSKEAQVWLLERHGDSPPQTIYDKHRAAKTFTNPDEGAVVRELSNWVVLHHTHVLPLIKIARLNFRIAALMEWCPGTLQDAIEQRLLTWIETRTILLQVVEALRYAHDEHQMSHLDIKPANIMIKKLPSHVQVADWGISRLASKGRIAQGGGTKGFYPPERLTGKPFAGPSSDIFGLGMTAFIALTRVLPYAYHQDEAKYGSEDEQRFMQLHTGLYIQNAKAILKPLPPAVQNLLLQMIHPDPSTRFADYGRLLRAIEEVAA